MGTDREEGSGVTSTATDSDVVDYSGVLEGLQSQLEQFQSSMSVSCAGIANFWSMLVVSASL